MIPAPPADHAFACALYKQLAARGDNLVVSPASLRSVLTMTWAGARSATEEQMRRVLGLPDDRTDTLDQARAERVRAAEASKSEAALRVANRLYANQACALEPKFIEETTAVFGASVEALDLQQDAEGSRQRINDWVAGETADKIRNLLPRDAIDAQTQLVIANAVHFLGKWAAQFQKYSTRPAPFFAADGTSRDVPTMQQTSSLRHAQVDGVQVLEMPYVGDTLAMTFLLPSARDGLADLEARLSPQQLAMWVSAARVERVMVKLPKFTIEPQATLAVAPLLRELGMPLAFDDQRADFTGIAPVTDRGRLFIGEVFHKAFVRVDEQGTEAAAASAVAMPFGAAVMQDRPVEFRADHPFMFVLRDLRTGTLHFVGRVVSPSS
jgi:serpin B